MCGSFALRMKPKELFGCAVGNKQIMVCIHIFILLEIAAPNTSCSPTAGDLMSDMYYISDWSRL